MLALLGSVALSGALLGAQTRADAGPQAWDISTLPVYGGEPSMVSDSKGVLYVATPTDGALTFRSNDKGKSWKRTESDADPASGDDCLGADQSDAIYLCNLAGSVSTLPLQADAFKTTDQGHTWTHGAGFAPMCGTSCSVFGVDRDWIDAAILPPATTTDQAEVVLMYHDFYGPTQIWVNISTDGGKTFGRPMDVLTAPAATPGAVAGTVVAQGYTMCNTVPAGVGIVRPGLPHAGRIYVGWIASDLPQNATGCNITMLQSFHTVWTAWSDDNGATWTPQQAIDLGVGHDASTPFVGFTMDNQGNPYFGFSAQDPSGNPAVCAAESSAGVVQGDKACQYNMYVVWSKDGGATWNDGTGLVPGSAGTPYEASPPEEVGTHFFPAIAAGDPGQVDVSYLYTPQTLPTDPLGKADPGGCAGPGPGNGNPPTYPPICEWNLEASQSLDLTAAPGSEHWSQSAITTTPMHVGDICNLGIFCVDPNSDRSLLDFIQESIDPSTGCAHIAYPDNNTVNKMRVANQSSGCLPLASLKSVSPAVTPAATASTPAPSPTVAPAATVSTPNTTATSSSGARAGMAALAALIAVAALAPRRRRRSSRDG